MKFLRAAIAAGAWARALAGQQESNPLGKVIDLISELEAKVHKEGEVEAKAYNEYLEWCDDTSKNGQYAVETAQKEKGKLEAKISKLSADIEVASSKIEDLASAISTAESELKNATLIRKKEAADYSKSETELMDMVDTLGRALNVLSKEMAKNPAALAQIDSSSTDGMLKALSTVLDAAAFPSADQKALVAFAQEQSDADDADLGAPAAAVYKTHSNGILDVLEDMKEKAEGQLSDLRKAEKNGNHNFQLLRQSLEDQMSADNKDMSNEKSERSAAQESKASASSDLDVTTKGLSKSQEELGTAKSSCIQTAADHEATVAAREEELKAIAEAKKILQDTSSGAVSQSYSFVQTSALTGSRLRSRTDLARSEVVAMIKQLAKKEHSAALAQLASRISAVVRFGAAGGADPFGKIKGMIGDMISKLEKEAGEEATEKAFCDEQMSKTEEKKGELEEDHAKMSTKIDQHAAKSAELKEQVRQLEAQLAALAKEQAEMDKMRQETHADFVQAKADLELGLGGVRKALVVLREYYGGAESAALLQDGTGSSLRAMMEQPPAPEKHSKASGAGSSIIGILEVVESDFAKNLAKEETQEDDAQSEYEKMTQENKITRTTQEQDVKYKGQESKSLDKTVAEISSDRETTATELDAVNDYYAKIKDRCIAKPESYESRKQRRTAEIEGLKEALRVLEEETAFVQRRQRGHFRGSGKVLAAVA